MAELTQIQEIFFLILTFIVILVLTSLIGYFVRKALKNKLSNHYLKLITTIIQYIIIIILTYYTNKIFFKFELGVFATSLGIISIAIAYSSQQIIQNFISGIIISFGGIIEIDDWVEIGPPSVMGKVKDITLMRIKIRDIQGKIHLIPNYLLMTTRVINYTKSGFVQIQLPLELKSDENYQENKKKILEILEKNNKVFPNVSRTEKSKISKMLRMGFVKDLYPTSNLSKFNPHIEISDIKPEKVTININFWIRDMSEKGKIVSEILEKIRGTLETKKTSNN